MRYKTKASWLGGPGILVLMPFVLPVWLVVQFVKLVTKPVKRRF